MFLPCHITHIDPDLAVLNFAERPHHCLPTPTDLSPFLGNAEGSNTITPSASPKLLADLARQGASRRLMIPRHISDELLDSLPFLIVQVRDPLACLALQPRHQAGHVLKGMLFLFEAPEKLCNKRHDEIDSVEATDP